MSIRESLKRRMEEARKEKADTAMRKEELKKRYKEAYYVERLKAMKKKARQDALAKTFKSSGFREHGVPSMKGVEGGLARGAKFGQALLGGGRPPQKVQKTRSDRSFDKDYAAYRRYLKKKKRMKRQRRRAEGSGFQSSPSPMSWI